MVEVTTLANPGLLAAAAILLAQAAAAQPATTTPTINIVAAENFYGDVAQQVAGAGVPQADDVVPTG